MQVLETVDQQKFEEFLLQQKASLLQSWAWGEFQKKLGRKVWRFILTTNLGKVRGAATVIKLPLPRGKSYLYAPRGPVFAKGSDTTTLWKLFLDKLGDIAPAEETIFFRTDPELEALEAEKIQALGLQKIDWEIQPKDTVILDLTQSEADILHRMKPKTRYNIRLAERKGVLTRNTYDLRDIKNFWQLVDQTTTRDGFSAHPHAYYQYQLEILGKYGQVHLITAEYKSRPLAMGIFGYFGKQALYLHGASSDRFRSMMAPYALQWEAIKLAKLRKCESYDFGGIAPEGAATGHAWQGITRFKKGFGGQTVSYVGAHDYVFSPGWYRIYNLVRTINRRLRR